MKIGAIFLIFIFALACPLPALAAQSEHGSSPRVLEACTKCHDSFDTLLRGKLKNVSHMDKTISLYTGRLWEIRYDENTKLEGWDWGISDIPEGRGMVVKVKELKGDLYAEKITLNKPSMGKGKRR